MSEERTIKPNAPADFTPQLGDYKTLQPFRYWCQKVLPLVYDDSLSYYELLCKVVDYLNKTMEDVETLHGDVTSLNTAYEELQSYVNSYFSTLDVQEEINNKLDNMAESGELYEIIRRYTDPIVNEQNEKINVLKVRMDTFSSLPDGSTSGDAELTDIRVGYNGYVYPNAGDAVREQAGGLNSDLANLKLFEKVDGSVKNGYYDTSGNYQSNTTYENMTLKVYNEIYVTTTANSAATIATYFSGVPSASTFIDYEHADYPSNYGSLSVTNYRLTIPPNTKYVVVNSDKGGVNLSVKINSTKVFADYVNKKVNGVTIYKNKGNLYKDNLYTISGNSISKKSYVGGYCCKYEITDEKYVIISGYGWDSQYGYFLYAFTDENENIISRINADLEHKNEIKILIPTNAKYLYVNGDNLTIPTIKIPTTLTDFEECLKATKLHKDYNILFLGDSITQLDLQERGWVKYFKEKVNCKRTDNVAVIGACWCDYNNNTVYNGNPLPIADEQNVIGNQIQKIINNRDNYAEYYDFVFIACGTNDNSTDGVLSLLDINNAYFSSEGILPLENVDRSNWAGATRYAVEKLRELFPSAKIIFNTPINRIDMLDSGRVVNNAKMIRQCSEVVSVLLCDTLHCGITMYDSSDFVDGLHPSVNGAKKIGYYNAEWFLSNCIN